MIKYDDLLKLIFEGDLGEFNIKASELKFCFKNDEVRQLLYEIMYREYEGDNPGFIRDFSETSEIHRKFRKLTPEEILYAEKAFQEPGFTYGMFKMVEYGVFSLKIGSGGYRLTVNYKIFDKKGNYITDETCYFGNKLLSLIKIYDGEGKKYKPKFSID